MKFLPGSLLTLLLVSFPSFDCELWQSACEINLLDHSCTMDRVSQWANHHFHPRPLIVLLGDSITQLGNDVSWGGQFGKDGPGWASAIQVLHAMSYTISIGLANIHDIVLCTRLVRRNLTFFQPSEAWHNVFFS
jgi:hypothetical protein